MYISNISINQVRHLKDIKIPLSEKQKKHLIITGKNGSGKTSLLDSIAVFLQSITCSDDPILAMEGLMTDSANLEFALDHDDSADKIRRIQNRIKSYQERIQKSTAGIMLSMNCPLEDVRPEFEQGEFVVAYYRAERVFEAQEPKHVEKVELKKGYAIGETPREDFIKYLVDLKMTQALAISNGKHEKAEQINTWFNMFGDLLRKIFSDDSVTLQFDEDTFRFGICMEGREPFDFNTLSSGYASVLDIVVDLIMRMESQINRKFDFSVPGIVLVDEIETHLHLELQKNILELLTSIFPNVQFIISTHSPFVLNSLEDVVIYDLEQHILVEHGLTDIPYDGIVEGYFNADKLSASLRKKFERYKVLAQKTELTESDFCEIADLELYLDEIPDYLALYITTEYQRLKMQMRNKEDI